MHSYYIATLLQVLEPSGVSRAQLLRNTGALELEPQTALNLTARQLDIACSNISITQKHRASD